MTNSSGCEAPRKKEKLLKACNSAYIHLLQARAPLKQTPHVNTSVWTDAPEKPTALRHRIDSGHPASALTRDVIITCTTFAVPPTAFDTFRALFQNHTASMPLWH